MTPITTDSNIQETKEAICKAAEPFIYSCIKQLPRFCRKAFSEELYNTAIVAILENFDRYDPAKGTVVFFYKYISKALHTFLAHDVFGFSSYEKYKDYNAICSVIPNPDLSLFTEESFKKISKATGLGKIAVISALNESRISSTVYIDPELSNYYMADEESDLDEHVCRNELESVVEVALNCLHGSDLEFVYDLCGFDGRPVLTPWQLQKKYSLTPTQYNSYLMDLKRKLMGSRKLRRYMGRVMLDQKYRIA